MHKLKSLEKQLDYLHVICLNKLYSNSEHWSRHKFDLGKFAEVTSKLQDDRVNTYHI